MSSSLLVDLGNTCQLGLSVATSGAFAASGALIGAVQNMQNANTFCNVMVAGMPTTPSGVLRIQVQSANTNSSGSFTDPTSGLAALPTSFSSGGILILNSGGLLGGVINTAASGQHFYSGFAASAGFQRPGVFVRANVLSGDFYNGALTVTFVSQLRTSSSGGGYSYQPTSGVVRV